MQEKINICYGGNRLLFIMKFWGGREGGVGLLIIWLVPQAGKMNQILCCDYQRSQDGAILIARDCPLPASLCVKFKIITKPNCIYLRLFFHSINPFHLAFNPEATEMLGLFRLWIWKLFSLGASLFIKSKIITKQKRIYLRLFSHSIN